MKLKDDVLAVLSALTYPAPNQARIVEQLDRAMYEKVNSALVAIGGKWNRKAKAHVFEGDAAELVDLAITTGEVQTNQDVGHFPTPVKLAAQLVEIADVRPGHTALEPSAGTGRIVDALLAVGGVRVYAVERDVDRRRILSEHPEVLSPGLFRVSSLEDFMEYPPRAAFDRVVMNPPFCKVGLGDHLDHVQKAFSLLKPGGVLVAVLPSSIEFRRDRRHEGFRGWCLGRGSINGLMPGAFRESGTDVNTCCVRLSR